MNTANGNAIQQRDNMVWPAIIAGAATLAGGLLSNRGARDANEASAFQAQQNRDFQERMSRTAHQREVADLRAAGLNPILSGTGGRGASTPGGAMAMQSDTMTPGIQSALATRRLVQELKNMKEQEKHVYYQGKSERERSKGAYYDQITSRLNMMRAATAQQIEALQGSLADKRFGGDWDAAELHSGWEGAAVRRAELAGKGVKPILDSVLPWGGAGKKRR